MHRSESNETYRCAACGEETSQRERAFAFGHDDELMCYGCAVDRNGIYNDAHDDWSVAPYHADLIQREVWSEGTP